MANINRLHIFVTCIGFKCLVSVKNIWTSRRNICQSMKVLLKQSAATRMKSLNNFRKISVESRPVVDDPCHLVNEGDGEGPEHLHLGVVLPPHHPHCSQWSLMTHGPRNAGPRPAACRRRLVLHWSHPGSRTSRLVLNWSYDGHKQWCSVGVLVGGLCGRGST